MNAQPYRILNQAIQTYKPSILVACFSGGYDSMVTTHMAARWAKRYAHSTNLTTIAVDTLISADGWREFVASAAREIGACRFQIWDNPDLDLWKQDIAKRGFVYRKAQHKFYFYYLKQRAFRAIVQHYKKHRTDHVMFINGVRRAESIDRENTPEIEKVGSGIYVNPIVHWTDEQVHQYRIAHDLPLNPFYDRFRNSGDCLCNWHNNIKLADLERHAPNVLATIAPLDRQCRADHGYGYDNEPSLSSKLEAAGQLPMFEWDTDSTPNLCAGCTKPEATNGAADFVSLQRMEW